MLSSIQVNSPRRLRFALGRVIDVGATTSACIASNDEGTVFVWGYGILGEGQTRRIEMASVLDQALFNGKVQQVHAGHSNWAAVNEQVLST
jgi:hypothetical protein